MTMSPSDMRCTVCKKPKNSLRPRKSKLIPGNKQMFLCEECFTNKREPRWAIILMARSEGPESVTEWVKNHRYVGEPILLSDLVG